MSSVEDCVVIGMNLADVAVPVVASPLGATTARCPSVWTWRWRPERRGAPPRTVSGLDRGGCAQITESDRTGRHFAPRLTRTCSPMTDSWSLSTSRVAVTHGQRRRPDHRDHGTRGDPGRHRRRRPASCQTV